MCKLVADCSVVSFLERKTESGSGRRNATKGLPFTRAGSVSPAPVMEYFSSAPAVFSSPEPVVETFSPVPAVFHETGPVVEYFSPAPAVFQTPAPVLDYIAPVAVESPSGVTGEDRQASVTGQSSTALRGAASPVCLFLGFAKLFHCRGGPWEPCGEGHAMLHRHKGTGRVRFDMFPPRGFRPLLVSSTCRNLC